MHRIHAEIKRGDTDVQIDACKGDDVKCPHCGSNHMGKWGSSAEDLDGTVSWCWYCVFGQLSWLDENDGE